MYERTVAMAVMTVTDHESAVACCTELDILMKKTLNSVHGGFVRYARKRARRRPRSCLPNFAGAFYLGLSTGRRKRINSLRRSSEPAVVTEQQERPRVRNGSGGR